MNTLHQIIACWMRNMWPRQTGFPIEPETYLWKEKP